MRMFLLMCLLVAVAIMSGCVQRTVDDLPQSTRIDREIVARASLAVDVADDATEEPVRQATFHTRDDGTIVFYISHQAPRLHPMRYGALFFRDLVFDRSGGTLVVEVLYGEDSLGGDVTLVNLVNDGLLDSAMITQWTAWAGLNELANLESLPFVFLSYEEAWEAYSGTFGRWVAQNVIESSSNVRVIGWQTNGLRHFTNNVRPIYTPDDMISLMMRSPQNSAHLATYDALGSASISMAFGEVYDAISEGRIDGQDNPIANIFSAGFHEVQRYLSLSYHMFSAAPIIVSNDLWEYLSEEHRQVLLDSAEWASLLQERRIAVTERDMINAMLEQGMQVNHVNTDLFIEAVMPVWVEYMGRFGTEFAEVASRYVTSPNALPLRFVAAGAHLALGYYYGYVHGYYDGYSDGYYD